MPKKLRIALIGCVLSTKATLCALLDLNPVYGQLVGVITRRKSKFNSDFMDISILVREHNIPILFTEDTQQDEAQK